MSGFNALIENLYQFHFRHWKGQVVVYALTFVIALLYAVINALVLGRSEQSVVFEMIGLTVILLVGLPVAYVYVIAVVDSPPPVSEEESVVISDQVTRSKPATISDSHNRRRPTVTTREPRSRETSMSDEELILRVKNSGDQDAYQDLYSLYSGRSLAICLRGTGNLPDAEDLNLEVWMKVWRRRETFRDDGVFVAWLIMMAVSACRDWKRKQRNPQGVQVVPREGQEGDTDEHWLDWMAQQAEQIYRRTGEAERIQQAWSHLSEEGRELLQQAYVDKLLRKDMTDGWGISAPTLRKRLEQVRDQFRKHLLEGGITLRDDN